MSQPGDWLRSMGSSTSEDLKSRRCCSASRESLDPPSAGCFFPKDNELDLRPGGGGVMGVLPEKRCVSLIPGCLSARPV